MKPCFLGIAGMWRKGKMSRAGDEAEMRGESLMHSVQGLPQGTEIVIVYTDCHRVSQSTGAVTEYRDYHSVRGLTQCSGAATVYTEYHRVQRLTQCTGLSQGTGAVTVYRGCHSVQRL